MNEHEAGMSGSDKPVWKRRIGETTEDGGIIWTSAGKHDDIVDATAFSIRTLAAQKPDTRVRGWLLTFIFSLATLFLWYLILGFGFRTDTDFNGFISTMFFILSAGAGVSVFFLAMKKWYAPLVTKGFLIAQAIISWLLWFAYTPFFFRYLFFTTCYALFAWVFLDESRRVQNTYGIRHKGVL
jgi:hypothetical protein